MNFEKLVDISKGLMPTSFQFKSFHVTFAFYKKKLIKIAVNKPHHTHPFNLQFNYQNRRENKNISDEIGLHSELACLLKIGQEDTSNLTFINIRIDKNNQVTNAKPCGGCQQALKQFGYKKVYYSCQGGYFQEFC